MSVRCSTQPESPLARIRRQSPRVSPSCTRVFGPIEAMIRDWRVGFDRTMAQFRATDVTHPPRVFDRAVDFGAGAARAVVARDGGAFAMARGVDLEAGARAVGGVVARARARWTLWIWAAWRADAVPLSPRDAQSLARVAEPREPRQRRASTHSVQ